VLSFLLFFVANIMGVPVACSGTGLVSGCFSNLGLGLVEASRKD